MADRPDACASLARLLGEPLPGTAPVATGWIVIEDPTPWGHDALTQGSLPDDVVAHLQAGIADRPIRHQAIRRPRRTTGAARTVFLVHGGATPWARRAELTDGELLDIDPAATLSSTPPEVGAAHHDPIVLVCTHARRDACCAERGVSVARAVAGLEPEATWETSHTGGHRFAPSVIVLPSGSVHGFMDEVTTLEAVAAARDRRIALDRFRGRSVEPRHVQAAEVWVRQQYGLDGLPDVLVEETVVEGDVALVRLRTPDELMTIRVRRHELDPRVTSCGDPARATDSWQVLDRVR